MRFYSVQTCFCLPRASRRLALFFLGHALCFTAAGLRAQIPTAPIEGLRDATPRVHAITGARIITAPGQVIERGTLVLRDGVIAAVGPEAEVKIPADARLWPVEGKTIYAGFVESETDAHLPAALKSAATRVDAVAGAPRGGRGGRGAVAAPVTETPVADEAARSWNPRVTPERQVARMFVADDKADARLRELGFTTAVVTSGRGVFRGQSALVSLNGKNPNAALVRRNLAQHVAFELGGAREQGYPGSLMGAIALIRQSLLDAQWHAASWKKFSELKSAGAERPEANASLAALESVTTGRLPVVISAQDELDLLRAQKIGDEFKLRLVIRGTGTEYRMADALAAAKTPLILPLNFPAAPEVDTPDKAGDVALATLQHWELAPANAGKLAARGVAFALTSAGLRTPETQFWTNLRLAVKRGLAPETALAALTTAPAKFLGLEDLVGTLATGRIANFVVATGDLFAANSTAEISAVWVDGDRFETDASQKVDVRGTWKIVWTGLPATAGTAAANPPGELKIDGRTATRPRARFGDKDAPLTVTRRDVTLLPAVELFGGKDGTVRLAGHVTDEEISGTGLLPDGAAFRWSATRQAVAAAPARAERKVEEKFFATADAYPAGVLGRKGPPVQPEWLLVKNATLWTSGPLGRIEGGDLLIHAGKIEKIGKGLVAPPGATMIDAAGKHVSAGLIDCHSHTAISRGINEATSAVTVEVRVGDVLDATDIGLYRELAGGLTVANILHGSANPMGGQNQVIKLRWGGLPETLKYAGAKPGVKFALGENVKQSSASPPSTRYPQTRMGVEQVMLDTFQQARDYERTQQEWREGKLTYAPRRNLRLESAVEMLHGERVVHIHSYRQDEVLMFIRLAEKLGLTVATFQHILEGYKVADQIAKIGAGASAFTDWWNYKYEVIDAIPQGGALMRAAGVVVSFNSDDAGLARRMNTEASKAMKYGGVPAEEALKFVTLNPAKQLRIDDRVGSLEAGKDADFVIWSASPLSTYARCEQTWIDGRRYFELGEDSAMRASAQVEREALVQKALAERGRNLATAGAGPGGAAEAGAPRPPPPDKPFVQLWLEELEARHALQYQSIYHDGQNSVNCSTHVLQ
ncbi:MAG: amidohydrolase [Opitutus sp.]|nr:amidohydrolase [Opitutus sp.]